MSVKFRVGFTMSAETLFGIIAKFVPIEDLEVEELAPRVETAPKPKLIADRKPNKRASRGPNLKKGVNGIIVVALKDKPLRAADLQPLVKAAGYSANSVNSRLEALHRFGVLARIGDGRWKLNAT
jgi:hypothetical protein